MSADTDLRTALDAALGHVPDPVAVSRAASPAVLEALAGRTLSLRPLYRGRTVWDAGDEVAAAVVESPNTLGRVENRPETGVVVVVTRPGSPVAWEATATVRHGAADAGPAILDAARLLAKHLDQIAGVTPAFGVPEASRFVVCVDVDPDVVVSAVEASAGVDFDTIRIDGTPGALLVEVTEGSERSAANAARRLASAMGRVGGAAG